MSHKPITERISQPTPDEIKAVRKLAKLTQTEATRLVTAAKAKPFTTWQGYEAPVGSDGHRAIPLATWELFLLLTDQHPDCCLVSRENRSPTVESGA